MNLGPEGIHLMVSHGNKACKAYNAEGKLLWVTPCLTTGVGGDDDEPGGDTPLGDYEVTGYILTTQEDTEATWASYGPCFFYLNDLEHQEENRGRASIGVHGGRQGKYAPDPSTPYKLYPTEGCFRIMDSILTQRLVPLYDNAKQHNSRMVVTLEA